jgi:hypothetical protein
MRWMKPAHQGLATSPGDWRCRPDLNRGIRVLQTLALPLGHGTDCCDAVFSTGAFGGQAQIVSVLGGRD